MAQLQVGRGRQILCLFHINQASPATLLAKWRTELASFSSALLYTQGLHNCMICFTASALMHLQCKDAPCPLPDLIGQVRSGGFVNGEPSRSERF